MGSPDPDDPSGPVSGGPAAGSPGAAANAAAAGAAPGRADAREGFGAIEPAAAGGERLLASGWTEAIGLQLLELTAASVVAQWDVGPRHLQPHGIVHGGVYASVVETCCSLGAQLAAPRGLAVVGVENHTSFIRPVREGRLTARAVPLHAGRRAQLWECSIVDASERLIATGRLRVMSVEAERR